MKRCPAYEGARHYRLADGRLKCRACGQRFSWTPAWTSVKLSPAAKHRLLELFVLGVPSYRRRFRNDASAAARERFYRLLRACCAQVEHLREPFEGAVECDETTFGGARKGKRGWGAAGKVIVFRLVKRNGRVKAMPIPLHDRASIMYLAEVCYRYNHRDEDLKPLLFRLLKQTSIQELRPTLVRKG